MPLKDKAKRREYNKKYSDDNKDKIRTLSASYYQKNPELLKTKSRNWTTLNLYNISPEQYNEMFTAQDGKCLICGTHQRDLKKALSIDHSHTTGKVRGLLCNNCNTGIGMLQDDIYLVAKALEYLQDAA